MRLPEQFKHATSNVEPSDGDKDNAKSAHAEVREVLEAADELKEFELDTILIGSYGRKVSMRRIKDVDVFSKLTSTYTDLEPMQLLGDFSAALVNHYGDRVVMQDRSIKVDFPDYGLAVDAVPARPNGEDWELPDKSGGWELTNPVRFGDRTTEANKKHLLGGDGIYVPTVKLVRQVRRALGIDRPSGHYFEVLTWHAFADIGEDVGSRAEYLTLALEGAAQMMADTLSTGPEDPGLPGAFVVTSATSDQLNSAVAKLQDAAAASRQALEEDDNECSSAKTWRDLLGKDPDDEWVFPMPEHCDEDGSKSAPAFQPGETRVPTGNDRYA